MSYNTPPSWGDRLPCDDNTPDMMDEIIAEATAEVISELNEILLEGYPLVSAAREAVGNNTPHDWEDLIDKHDLADQVVEEVTDAITWAIKNNKL